MADASNIFRQYSQSFVYVSKAKAVRPQAALSILYKEYRVLFCIKCIKSTFFIDAFGNMWYYIVNVNGCAYVFIVYTAISWSVYTASDRMPPVHAKLRTAYIEMDCGPG